MRTNNRESMKRKILSIGERYTAKCPLAAELIAKGYDLCPMADDADPLALAAGEPPVAIICDAGHIEAAAHLRDALKGTDSGHPPLLVISEDTALQLRLNALRHGADAFFPPPLDPQAVTRRLEELAGIAAKHSPYKVVVVDDDPTQADFAAAILRKSGIEVTTVTESLRILDTLRTFRPELILMDVYMPEASGVELTTIIREQKDLMDIPVVYLSAEHDPDKQLDALSVGGEDFLTKPIRPKQLIATVRNRIDRARQLRETADPRKRSVGDPALVRKHILALLEHLHSDGREEGLATGLCYLELDNPVLLLEQVNLDGIDQVMSEIQAIAQSSSQTGDRVARFGDFCLVLILRRDFESELVDFARKLRERVMARRFQTVGGRVNTSVSIGVRLLGADDQDASKLINEAIKACHQARVQADGGIQVQHPPRRDEPAAAQRLDPDLLERVAETENLNVMYQPIVPLHQGSEYLYQCLLRLRSGDGDLLAAGAFLPEVEQTGRILKLDRWMILKALVTLHKKSKGLMGLFVSQSATALKDPQRIDWLADRLQKTRVEPKRLIVEFPFPEIAFDMSAAAHYLRQLRGLGIGISLNCLRDMDALLRDLAHLPVDFIKITENQIRNYPDTWKQVAGAAHRVGPAIIVSRIEHPELLGQLWTHGVDYIQGNFIQQPAVHLEYDFAGAVLG